VVKRGVAIILSEWRPASSIRQHDFWLVDLERRVYAGCLTRSLRARFSLRARSEAHASSERKGSARDGARVRKSPALG
jgi:hypothetical protein